MKIRAITAYVYRNSRLGDCTLGGISSKYDTLLIACPDGPDIIDTEVEIPDNFAMVELRHVFGNTIIPTIYPAEVNDRGEIVKRGGKWWMMGGNFANTSDSRFARLTNGMYGAVAIHDRYETPEQYEMYSR